MKGTNKTRPRRKCEKMKDTNFSIHNFMIDELKLDGVPLKVYALIYSFTRAGGDCHGSIEYICERVGASRTSVKTAIKRLIENDYIIKIDDNQIKTNRYRANDDYFPMTGQNPTGQKLTLTGQKTTPPGQNLTPDRSEIDPNNKDNNKAYNYTYNHLYFNGKPRPIQAFGSKRLVMMTLHEYTNLLRAAGVLPTLRYVRLLENRITANRLPVKENHYEMIIDWAREDGLVTPEGEEILRN